MNVEALPPLRDVIERHGLAAKKALGQNFLLDLNVTRKIARLAGPLAGTTVLEIGPGPGGLTRALLLEGAERVVAIERDERCLPALREIEAASAGRLEIVSGDALAIEHRNLLGEGPVRIAANLPYNIATPLLTDWLEGPWPPFWSSMTLMFQREVAERIVAVPGSKAYGRLSVLCGWRARASIAMELDPRTFSPPPKVHSAVVRFDPRVSPLPCELSDLTRVTKAAFGQRRKMLRQSLKPLGGEELLRRAGLEPTARAETIPVEGFVDLANALAA